MTAVNPSNAVERSAPASPGAETVGAGRGHGALSTLNDDGSRRWLKPRPSKGRFLTRRRAVAYLLIALFTAIPYIPINGWPAVLLDLGARRFHIVGFTFLPTDTLLLAILLVTTFLTIFFLTALFGRVWCGWACPQTVYMEFLYRPIERLFDGTPGRAIKNKFQGTGIAKGLKFVTFFLVSCYLAHTFLAYFVGVEQLRHWVTQSPFKHPAPFLVMAVVTGLMMFDFVLFREQTCLVACPYGRFQSVMLDRHSLIVTYDPIRGEPRGKKSVAAKRDVALPVVTGPAAPAGDCVDCKLCVVTCPTGIDIRNGLQMECVNCAQCIDACDAVMAKLGRAPGLIRYSSQAAVERGTARWLRPRVVVYPTLIAVLVTAFAVVFASKGSADVSVLRGRGAPFVQLDAGMVGNQIKIKVVNRSSKDAAYTLSAEGPADGTGLRPEENPVRLKPGEVRTVPALLVVPTGSFDHGHLDVRVRVTDGGDFNATVPFRMVGPGTTARQGEHGPDHDTGHEPKEHS